MVFECFLSRIFAEPSTDWVLKGGTALLMRNGSGRFTKDFDLAHGATWGGAEEIAIELQSLLKRGGKDPFRFQVIGANSRGWGVETGYGNPSIAVTVGAYLGTGLFHSFRIDVTPGRHTQLPPETVEIDPLLNRVTKEKGYKPFRILVTPIEAHLADKICAMRESHHGIESTRFHDLADIIEIIRTQDFLAEKLLRILTHEVKRRGIDWPQQISSPGKSWENGFSRKASSYGILPENLHNLEEALAFAGNCLNQVLQRKLVDGKWNHSTGCWEV